MASTYTLQNTVNFIAPYVKLMPLQGVGGVANEPALSIANMVLQTILGAPFKWRWNRAQIPLAALVAGTQDYKSPLPTLGFLEKSFLSSASGNSIELETRQILSADTQQGRPNYIAPQLDDGNGNVTLRFLPVPDAAYTVTLIGQQKANLFTQLSQTWAPIPDELAYVYNLGFMGFALLYANDARFPWAMQRFLAGLIGASEGLSEQEKDIFLGNWMPMLARTGPLVAQMGAHARGGM